MRIKLFNRKHCPISIWFAWKPVMIDGCFVWLEKVEKEEMFDYEYGTYYRYHILELK